MAMLEQTAKTQLAQKQLEIDENLKMAQLRVDQELTRRSAVGQKAL